MHNKAWREWAGAFPDTLLAPRRNRSQYRRAVELAAAAPLPTARLTASDRAAVLALLASHVAVLEGTVVTSSRVAKGLAVASGISGALALFIPPLVPVSATLAGLTGGALIFDDALGGAQAVGDQHVIDALVALAERLP